jgi:hypothetical protein
MISGDGNFHLHSYSKVDDEFESPSVFGDFGFWVPHEISKKYTEFADAQKTYASVKAPFHCQLTDSLDRCTGEGFLRHTGRDNDERTEV